MPVKNLDLSGIWKLTDTDHMAGKTGELLDPELDLSRWLDTPVPGDIHPTLVAEGRLPDPFMGLNTEQCLWTGHRDWWHRHAFKVPKSFTGEKTELVLDGVDTYSTVFFNGEKVGETANMFRQYRFDVTALVRPGETNTVAVCVWAVLPTIEARDTSKYFACFYTPRIFARKSQCQFSWDWAPNLPALGIWRGVRLECRSKGVIENVHVRTRRTGEVTFHVQLDQYGKRIRPGDRTEYTLHVEVKNGAKPVRAEIPVSGGKNFINLTVPNPKLWWPNGYGDPNLYTYTVTLRRGKMVCDTVTGRFGIREVELVEEPQDTARMGFAFLVNGVRVFCQGANWVPADCFPGTVGRDHYEHLLRLTRDAHFNMLRIWGGGIYEQDDFYDLCDEMGIMIWQDMMFACSDIPDDDTDFVLSLVPEFEYQVTRLRNHPCIAHWCGGNEKTGTFGAMMHYGDLVVRFLARGIVKDLCPDLSYTSSSPYSLSDVGNDPPSGDTHGGCWEHAFKDDMARFRHHVHQKEHVFSSEFGAPGPCQMRSIRNFIPGDKLWPLNEVWEAHVQDNPYNDLKETFVQVQEAAGTRLFHAPQSAAEFVKVGGTWNSELLAYEMEFHRRRFPQEAGGMIWMMNDCWPCASWSLIDYYGLQKQVYYALKRVCAPVTISVAEADDTYEVHVVNTPLKALQGELVVSLHTLDGGSKTVAKAKVRVAPQGAASLLSIPRKGVDNAPGHYLHATFTTPAFTVSKVFFHKLWKDLPWPDPGLSVRAGKCVPKGGEYAATITIKAKHFARCVNLITDEDIPAYYGDNFFDMVPGETRKITVQARQPFAPDKVMVRHWLDAWD